MQFEIYCHRLGSRTLEHWNYDNTNNEVCSEYGKPLCWPELMADERFARHESVLSYANPSQAFQDRFNDRLDATQKSAFAYSPDNPLKGKSRQVSKLKIQLGLACNYRCSYCLQSADRAQKLPYPTIDRCQSFFDMMQRNQVVVDPNGIVDLWGGEPLVYWDAVTYMVKEIRRRWGWGIKLNIFTNGTLITDDKSQFFAQYRVFINISHDGPGFAFRHNADPLNDPTIRQRWLNLLDWTRQAGCPMAFFAVINPMNCDLFALRDYFRQKFEPQTVIAFGGAASEWADIPQTCLIDERQSKVLRESMLKAMLEEPGQWPGIERRVFNMMGRIIHQTPADRIRYHCNAVDPKVLCVSIDGTVLSCQNRTAPKYAIGTLDDFDNIENRLFTHFSHRAICRDCLVLGACKGGCPDLKESEQARCCTNDFAFQYAVFYCAWFLLTGTLIESVTPPNPFAKVVIGTGSTATEKPIAFHTAKTSFVQKAQPMGVHK
ncbi:MAG: radical SAM protein [Sutterellaceae bacterium]|nr:radical SAM protein [Sutterellaceae bacterium]